MQCMLKLHMLIYCTVPQAMSVKIVQNTAQLYQKSHFKGE